MKVRIYFVLLAVVLGTARVSLAKTLFGQNYTALSYSYFDYGDGANYFTAMLGCWFTEDLMGTIGIGRETDADSTYFQAGAVFAF